VGHRSFVGFCSNGFRPPTGPTLPDADALPVFWPDPLAAVGAVCPLPDAAETAPTGATSRPAATGRRATCLQVPVHIAAAGGAGRLVSGFPAPSPPRPRPVPAGFVAAPVL